MFQGVLSQVDMLAKKIPEGALVLVPDKIAGTHLGLTLHYRHGFETLLLPLDYSTGRRLNETVRSFLDAEKTKRPMVVLSMEDTHQVYPLAQFYRLRETAKSDFSFSLVPRGLNTQVPGFYFFMGVPRNTLYIAGFFTRADPEQHLL